MVNTVANQLYDVGITFSNLPICNENAVAAFFLHQGPVLVVILLIFGISFAMCAGITICVLRCIKAMQDNNNKYTELNNSDAEDAPTLFYSSRIVYPTPLSQYYKLMPNMQVPCSIFSWLAYAPRGLVNADLNTDTGYARLEGFGSWHVANEICYEFQLFSVHVVVVQNAASGNVVFAFRGTMYTKEAFISDHDTQEFLIKHYGMTHSSAYKTRQPNMVCGSVQSMVMQKYECIKHILRSQVKLFGEAKYQIVFTGYDQGAAVASVAMLDCLEQFPELSFSTSLFTFGCPKFASIEFCNHFRTMVPQDRVHHYVTSFPCMHPDIRDLVTLLPNHSKPPKFYIVPGTTQFIRANLKYAGNPSHLKHVAPTLLYYPTYKHLPLSFLIHSVQCYVDGLLFEQVSSSPFLNISIDDLPQQQVAQQFEYFLLQHKKYLLVLAESSTSVQEPQLH